MKRFFPFLLAPALSGCLTATVAPVSYWPVEYKGGVSSVQSAKFGVARALPIVVRSPYNARSLTVLRADGTVAFDPLNEFAAPPTQLAKGVLVDALTSSGLFRDVVESGSIASADVSVEVVVERLALDCRQKGSRTAMADVVVKVLKGHAIAASVRGSGAVGAADGNYGVALSGALSSALVMALGQLR